MADADIATILAASPTALRHLVLSVWNNSSVDYRPLTLAAGLMRVKDEKLWRTWRHKKFFEYCRNEVRLYPISSENYYLALIRRFLAWGCTPEELEEIERKKYPLVPLGRVAKYVTSKKKVMEALETRQTLKDAVRSFGITTRRSRILILKDLSTLQLETLERVIAHLAEICEVKRSGPKPLVALALIYKAHLEQKPYKRWVWLKRQCKENGLNPRLANLIFGMEILKKEGEEDGRHSSEV